MKICPRCQKTYTDDNLNFCLEDGSVLNQMQAQPQQPPQQQQQAPAQPPPTVQMNDPRTNPQAQAPPSQPGGQPAWNTAPQPYSMQPPKKSSKTWVWVVLILGILILVCGGGFVGFLAYVGSQAEKSMNLANTTNNRGSNSSFSSNNKSSNSTTQTNSTADRSNVEKVDLGDWVSNKQLYGNTEFTDGEFIMSSRQKGYYYVLAGTAEQKTVNANTRVTVRNVDSADSSSGYGIVFHSNTTPLQQGYALLIDSKTRKFRVVHHVPGKESVVVAWTKSDAIQPGGADNVLEVRDLSDKIELYINGTMVKSIPNTYGYPDGVVGLYASDAIKIGFKDMEIHK